MNRTKTVPLTEIAALFGVSREAIRQWRKQGMPSRLVDGRPAFVVAECVRWRLEQDRGERRPRGEGSETKELKDRLLRAQADRAEVELALVSGELINRSDSEEQVRQFIGQVVAGITGRLTQFERQIVECKTPGRAKKIIDQMRFEMFGEHCGVPELTAAGQSQRVPEI